MSAHLLCEGKVGMDSLSEMQSSIGTTTAAQRMDEIPTWRCGLDSAMKSPRVNSEREWPVRLACEADVPALEAMIPISVRGLQASYYSQAQMQAALGRCSALTAN